VEAALDFPEEDVKEVDFADAARRVTCLMEQIQSILSGWEEGHVLREGALVVILGPPNVGKSTLLNRLLEKERAIVTEIPGTTRDSIEETCIVRGIPLRLVDTAGLRATDCTIEQMGVDRARAYLPRADIVLFVLDGSGPLDQEARAHMQSLDPRRSVLVLNKADLGEVLTAADFPEWACVTTSLSRNHGLGDLRTALVDRLGFHADREPHAVISERHRQGLLRSVRSLDACGRLIEQQREDALVLIASELRQACDEIGRITGRAYDMDLLDHIFSSFCIGK
jgi:tRNA modification GTPase